jgi:aryl-alcohol dehydrogenase-like predicted oxidoreductase
MNALDRRVQQRVVPAAAARGVALVVRSVLLRGILTAAGAQLDGTFAPLRRAADDFRRAAGASWDALPGAAVAYVATRPGPACILLGPRDVHELDQLLDGTARFVERAATLDGDWGAGISEQLLDPSRWPLPEAVA